MTRPDLHAATLQPIKQTLKTHGDGSDSLPVSSEHTHLASNDMTLLAAVGASERDQSMKNVLTFQTNTTQAQFDSLQPS